MNIQTRTSGSDAATLGLGSVLVGSLPAALLTDESPDRYTVEAVFTRRPDRDEVVQILDNQTREALTRAGYPTVEITVSDRRLEIANTNLEELRDGLATVLAERLAAISDSVRAGRDEAAVRSHDAAATEHLRAAAVVELAGSVAFRRSGESATATALPRLDADEQAQIEEWNDDGGDARTSS